jgi:hypothetical protein
MHLRTKKEGEDSPIDVEHFVALVVVPNFKTRPDLNSITLLRLFQSTFPRNCPLERLNSASFPRLVSSFTLYGRFVVEQHIRRERGTPDGYTYISK